MIRAFRRRRQSGRTPTRRGSTGSPRDRGGATSRSSSGVRAAGMALKRHPSSAFWQAFIPEFRPRALALTGSAARIFGRGRESAANANLLFQIQLTRAINAGSLLSSPSVRNRLDDAFFEKLRIRLETHKPK